MVLLLVLKAMVGLHVFAVEGMLGAALSDWFCRFRFDHPKPMLLMLTMAK